MMRLLKLLAITGLVIVPTFAEPKAQDLSAETLNKLTISADKKFQSICRLDRTSTPNFENVISPKTQNYPLID